MGVMVSDDGKGKYEIKYGEEVLARVEGKGDKIHFVRSDGQELFLPDSTDERVYSSALEFATALAYHRQTSVKDNTLMAEIISEADSWHASERVAR